MLWEREAAGSVFAPPSAYRSYVLLQRLEARETLETLGLAWVWVVVAVVGMAMLMLFGVL